MIDSLAGTITQVNLQIILDPQMCMMYESCIREVLCKTTQCIYYIDGSILINWIW